MPGHLVINSAYTQYQITIAKTQYEAALCEHQTYILMQISLIALVQNVVQSKYTNPVRNRITGQFTADIRLLKTHLFDTYGRINENELQTKYDETTKLAYNVSGPIDDIFNSVEDICEISELANCPYSARQQVNIGYLIVSRQPIFRSDVRIWMRKPTTNKTWTNSMTHFCQAHQELRDTGTTIDELGFQSANAIVEQIVERLREAEEKKPVISPPPPSPVPQEIPQDITIQTQQYANAVIPPVYQTSLVQSMMQNMRMMHNHMHQNYTTGHQGRGRGCGRGRGRDCRGRGRGRTHSGGGSYCHTHGNCNHLGENCKKPGEDHNPADTFTNMLIGSATHCFWITPK